MKSASFRFLLLTTFVAAGLAKSAAQDASRATAQAVAPVDLTGYWVSVITEDWRWRMVVPAVGDHSSVPLNVEGRRITDGWDPTADATPGNACKAYGAAGIMRIPGRLHITWQDPDTLKIDTDAGEQTRLFRFGAMPATPAVPTWQGRSAAAWVFAGAVPRRTEQAKGGSLVVETTRLKAGYLRRNGVPYSDGTVLTEYFDHHEESNGDHWLTVVTVVHDPKFLYQDFITSTHFKKEPDGAKWRPTPCTVEPS